MVQKSVDGRFVGVSRDFFVDYETCGYPNPIPYEVDKDNDD